MGDRVLRVEFPIMSRKDERQNTDNATDFLEYREKISNWLCVKYPSVLDPEDIVQEAFSRFYKYQKTKLYFN